MAALRSWHGPLRMVGVCWPHVGKSEMACWMRAWACFRRWGSWQIPRPQPIWQRSLWHARTTPTDGGCSFGIKFWLYCSLKIWCQRSPHFPSPPALSFSATSMVRKSQNKGVELFPHMSENISHQYKLSGRCQIQCRITRSYNHYVAIYGWHTWQALCRKLDHMSGFIIYVCDMKMFWLISRQWSWQGCSEKSAVLWVLEVSEI